MRMYGCDKAISGQVMKWIRLAIELMKKGNKKK